MDASPLQKSGKIDRCQISGSSSYSQGPVKHGGEMEKERSSFDPHFTSTNQEGSLREGNHEISETQIIKLAAGKKSGIETNQNSVITEQESNKKEFAFIESKKRRTGHGLDSLNNMVLNNDVIMELRYDPNEEQRNNKENNVSKNDLRASFPEDARLSL